MQRFAPWIQALLAALVLVAAIVKIDDLVEWRDEAEARLSRLEQTAPMCGALTKP